MRGRDKVLLALPPALALFVMQYAGLYLAVTSFASNAALCNPDEFYAAWRGWDSGVCKTEEQIWCKTNNNRHVDCVTADCRAEEIRLSLWPYSYAPPRRFVYAECAFEIMDHIEAINGNITKTSREPWNKCGACVPKNDKRAAFLPHCSDAEASCRGLFYRPRDRRDVLDYACDAALFDVNSSCATSYYAGNRFFT
jgi:hypothetical protein